VDEIERGLLAVEVHVAAAGIKHWLPQWFLDLNDSHHAFVDGLRVAGLDHDAAMAAEHGPCFEDGPMCSKGGSPYPCSVVRSFGDETAFAGEVAALWDAEWPGWRDRPCGVDIWEEA
jgi:hypothetical protein